MSFGFSATNDSLELLVTTDAKCLHYLGKATYLGPAQLNGANSPFSSLWRIYSPNSFPLVFARLNIGDYLVVLATEDLGGGFWQIRVAGSIKDTAELLCFAPLMFEAPASAWGMRVQLADGQVAYDSTRNPLWLSEQTSIFVQRGSLAQAAPRSDSQRVWGYSYTRPAITCYQAEVQTPSPQSGGGQAYLGVERLSSGHIYRWIVVVGGASNTERGLINVNQTNWIIETNGL